MKPSMAPSSIQSAQQPSKARYWVVVFAVTLAILSYIDRVAISQAAPLISKDFNLDKQQMGFGGWHRGL